MPVIARQNVAEPASASLLSASEMLKKSASGVLSSSKSSTYPRGYASGFDSPAALLDELFEHPAWHFLVPPKKPIAGF
jgi:hypothetical protein